MLKLLTAILSLALMLGLLAIELEIILILYSRVRRQHRRKKRKRRRQAKRRSSVEKTYDAVPQQDPVSEEPSFYKAGREPLLIAGREAESGDRTEDASGASLSELSVLKPAESEFGAAGQPDPKQAWRPTSAGMEAEQAIGPTLPEIEPGQSRPVIRLGFEQEWNPNSYSSPPDIIEKEDGELVIQKILDFVYYVAPYEEILPESRLYSSAVWSCFKMVSKNGDGKKYHVTVIEPAILSKEGDVYKVFHVGKLSVEGM